jgi:hypothetical protein
MLCVVAVVALLAGKFQVIVGAVLWRVVKMHDRADDPDSPFFLGKRQLPPIGSPRNIGMVEDAAELTFITGPGPDSFPNLRPGLRIAAAFLRANGHYESSLSPPPFGYGAVQKSAFISVC